MKAAPRTLMDFEEPLKAPFPYFGGKSRVADIVWQALGDCDHYLEPFFGSGAVLLARTNWRGLTETVCDKDGFVANAWRAIQFDPDEVTKWCDWPVNHTDLNARRKYLRGLRDFLIEKLDNDPDYYDPKIAGFWIWVSSASIGKNAITQIKSIPHLTDKGTGIHRVTLQPKVYLQALSYRLRYVRVASGDWKLICGGNRQDQNWQSVGFFFDPPYGAKAQRKNKLYTEDSLNVAEEVSQWCLERSQEKPWRIVLAGYFDEHKHLLDQGWHAYRWKTCGGYGNASGRRNENAGKETLFLNPHCLNIERICHGR